MILLALTLERQPDPVLGVSAGVPGERDGERAVVRTDEGQRPSISGGEPSSQQSAQPGSG